MRAIYPSVNGTVPVLFIIEINSNRIKKSSSDFSLKFFFILWKKKDDKYTTDEDIYNLWIAI